MSTVDPTPREQRGPAEPSRESKGDLRERLSKILRARTAGPVARRLAAGPREEAAAGRRQGLWLAPPAGTDDVPGRRSDDLPGCGGEAASDRTRRALPPRRLQDFLPGVEVSGERGACWLGRWPLDDRALGADAVASGIARGLALSLEALHVAREETPPAGNDAPPRPSASPRGGILLLDLETTGFAGTPLFLAGFLEVGPGRGDCVEQLFARDYSEEAALLDALSSRLARAALLVTFNGKTFDVPFLRDRAACHHIAIAAPPRHLDLLHPARRIYRGILPNCRLQTLESHMGGMTRAGDVPGWEIPSRYHDAVRRGDPSGLFGVFLHNARDLLTLARLYLEVGEGKDSSGPRTVPTV